MFSAPASVNRTDSGVRKICVCLSSSGQLPGQAGGLRYSISWPGWPCCIRRCGLSCYRRLGNWLARNLRQGLSGAERMLEEEMEQALSEKRNRALRYGEEAGTKLLFPMGLMLCIVLIMLLVPAFMQLY